MRSDTLDVSCALTHWMFQGWVSVVGSKATVSFCLFYECTEDTLKERLLKRGETSGRADDNGMCVCVYVCMYVCMYTWNTSGMQFNDMYVCIYIYNIQYRGIIHIAIVSVSFVCMCVCTRTGVNVCEIGVADDDYIYIIMYIMCVSHHYTCNVHTRMYVCMYVCLCACCDAVQEKA